MFNDLLKLIDGVDLVITIRKTIKKQDLFINSTLAHLGADLLWKLFSKGKLDMHGLFLNLERMVVNPIRLKKGCHSDGGLFLFYLENCFPKFIGIYFDILK